MGRDRKYGIITTTRGGSSEGRGIPDDEPVFLIRGKDAAAVMAIRDYARQAGYVGASDAFVENVEDIAVEIEMWQNANQDRVKVPD